MTTRQSLSTGWSITAPEHTTHGNIHINATMPTTVFEALEAHGIIENPFYGTNEKDMAWVHQSDWIYSKVLTLSAEDLGADELILRFFGLDTAGVVYLNDVELGRVDNMHRTWEFRLLGNHRSTIRVGENRLKIHFFSPTGVARKEVRKHRRNLREFPWYMKSPTLKGVSYMRKALYSFGWDWGPQLPDTGIWRDVELERITYGTIKELKSSQNHTYLSTTSAATGSTNQNYPANPIEQTVLQVSCNWQSFTEAHPLTHTHAHTVTQDPTVTQNPSVTQKPNPSQNPVQAESFGRAGKIAEHQWRVQFTLSGKGYTETYTSSSGKARFVIESPALWWTHDLGEPALYTLSAELWYGETHVDTETQHIGLRDIQLVRTPDQWGETFYFTLNGVPLFAKGANWIPTDSFLVRGKKLGLYEKRIDDALAANMNMLRVWGGGVYEDDLFYNLCDQKGILVWQDFMFACFIPPKHGDFLHTLEEEIADNIRRLRHHASLAIWVGNNEIEEMWYSLFYRFRFPKYKESYLHLFEDMLPHLVLEHDPGRPYWPSSPSSGGGFHKPESPDFGDSHFWSVWHGGKPFSAYREHNSRFMSEFGFESFPVMQTISQFSEPEDWSFESRVMANHQKNGAGNKKILAYMKKRFTIPAEFSKQVALSQITQAEAMEYGIDHWRRNRHDYHCMGALYWQFNDCWPVASWSSVDYYGRWKALHYFAKRFFSPLYANVAEFDNSFEIWGVNDGRTAKSVMLRWWHYHEDGTFLSAHTQQCVLGAADSHCIERVKLTKGVHKGILFFTLEEGSNVVYQGMKLLQSPADYTWQNPKLKLQVLDITPTTEASACSVGSASPVNSTQSAYVAHTCTLRITAEKPAIYVHWQLPLANAPARGSAPVHSSAPSPDSAPTPAQGSTILQGYQRHLEAQGSDNYFSLMPGESRDITITISAGNPLSAENALTDKPLTDTAKATPTNISDIAKNIQVASIYDLCT